MGANPISIRRLVNGMRKLAAGLRPFSESVWPGVRNDLFVAHESIYAFAAGYVHDSDVLDAGCGTGYGTHMLASAGARSAIGVDLDARSVAYARRHYRLPKLSYRVADLEHLDFPDATFGFVVASNALEHLHDPALFLRSLRRVLRPNGKALIAVPPIYTSHDAKTHAGIHYHRSNLTVQQWTSVIGDAGFDVSAFFHESRTQPDFQSHAPSTLSVADFAFTPTPVAGMMLQPSITAVFLLETRT
jgi:SAM-dependent methyltransferase